jgi:tRNA pseudouridine55 synthase
MMATVTGNGQNQSRLQDKGPLPGGTDMSCREGVYPVDKPAGVSSFRMVQLLRQMLGIRKVGHTGTLDPFATGVLVLCAGRPATRLIPELMAGDKEYEATLQLGVVTETQDPEGKILEKRPVGDISPGDIDACLEHFTGEQLQTPPAYSALKHKGKPLYHYARLGIKVVKEPRPIVVKRLECLVQGSDRLTIRVTCSKGTYIRTLAADIGEFFGCGAFLCELKRTRNGFFSLGDTLPGQRLLEKTADRSLLEAHRIELAGVKELLAATEENK